MDTGHPHDHPTWRLAAALLLLTALAAALGLQREAPPSRPATPFSATAARKHLDFIARDVHPSGTPAHDRVHDQLIRVLASQGLQPVLQDALVELPRHSGLGRVHNVMVRLPGTTDHGALLVAAHYDSVEGSYGASDDGIGCAAMLEVVRILKSEAPLRQDVIFLFSDAEEAGLLGAKAFVESHPWARDVRMVVNLEARGTSGAAQMFQTSPGNAGLMRVFGSAVPDPRATSLAGTIYRMLPNDTDFTEFLKHGHRGYNVAIIGSAWNYHTPFDCVESMDPASLQHMGDSVLGLVHHFGREGFSGREEGEAVYFNVAGSAFVRYGTAWALPLAVLLAMATAVLGILGLRRGVLKGRGLAWSSLTLLAVFLVSALAGRGLGWLAERLLALHPGIHPLAFAYSTYWGLVPLGLGFLVAWGGARLLARRAERPHLAWLHLAFSTLLSLALAKALPGLSYITLWPAVGTAAALALDLGEPSPWKDWVAPLAALVPTALLLGPLAALLGPALGWSPLTHAAVPVLGAIMLWNASSLLARLEEGSPRLVPATVAVLALAGLLGLWLQARDVFPGTRFTGIHYLADATSGKAFWATRASQESPWTRGFMPSPREGRPWPLLGGRPVRWLQQEATLFPVEPARLEVLGRDAGSLKLRIHPARRSTEWRLVAERGTLSGATFNGLPVPILSLAKGALTGFRILAPGTEPVELELRLDGTPTLTFEERRPGLPGPAHDMPLGWVPIAEGNATFVRQFIPAP